MGHNTPYDMRECVFPDTYRWYRVSGQGWMRGHGPSLPTDEGWGKGAEFTVWTSGVPKVYYNGGTSTTASWSVHPYVNDTYWDDLTVEVSQVKVPTVAGPDWDAFMTGLQVLWFDKSTDQSIYFAKQIPHRWKQGTDIEAHVHWVPKSNKTGDTICWALEYTFAEIGSVFSTAATIANTPVATDYVANTHLLTEIGSIDMSAVDSVSSMIVCRLYRDVSADDYDDDAGFLEFDFHYQIDSLGSDSEFTK